MITFCNNATKRWNIQSIDRLKNHGVNIKGKEVENTMLMIKFEPGSSSVRINLSDNYPTSTAQVIKSYMFLIFLKFHNFEN